MSLLLHGLEKLGLGALGLGLLKHSVPRDHVFSIQRCLRKSYGRCHFFDWLYFSLLVVGICTESTQFRLLPRLVVRQKDIVLAGCQCANLADLTIIVVVVIVICSTTTDITDLTFVQFSSRESLAPV